MQVVICGAESNQVTAIKDAIKAMAAARNGLSLESTYAAPTGPGPKDKILIILLPDEKAGKEDLSRLEDLRKRIIRELSLEYHQVVRAEKWR